MKKIFICLKILVSIALLAGLAWIMRDKFANIAQILLGANVPLVFLSIFLVSAGMIIMSYRLRLLLEVQGIHLKIKDLTCLTLIGQFFNNFMPTSIGGDVVKAYYASNGTTKKLETFASIAIDRMLGVITLMWIALVALISRRNCIPNKAIIVITGIIFIAGMAFMGLIFNKRLSRVFLFFKERFKNPKLKEQLQRLYDATNKYRHHKALVLRAIWLSLIGQLIFFVMVYILALSIDSKISFVFLLLTLPAVAVVSMLPSLNGLGIRESGFVYFLGGVMGKEKAFALSLLNLGVLLLVGAIGGIIFLFKREFKHIGGN